MKAECSSSEAEVLAKEFLGMICCPENRSALAMADAVLVERLNESIRGGRLKNRGGQSVEESLDGAPVREDHTIAYPIIHDLPILLVDEGIPLKQINDTD